MATSSIVAASMRDSRVVAALIGADAMSLSPVSATDLHPAFEGADHLINVSSVPTELGAVSDLRLTFILSTMSGTVLITKKNLLAGGSDSDIVTVDGDVGGAFKIVIAPDETTGACGSLSYQIIAEGTDVDNIAFKQIIAWGRWEIVRAIYTGNTPFNGPW